MAMHTISVFIATVSFILPPFGQEPIVDVADGACRGEMLISQLDEMYVYASCTSSSSERTMRVSVANRAAMDLGPLHDFSIGFCGPSVINVSAAPGWEAKVEGLERHDVTWSLPDSLIDSLGIRSGGRADGFVVRLKPGWSRSRSVSAWWGDAHIVTQLTTHDC
jgi:hypothetical protein